MPFLAMISEVHGAKCEYYRSHRFDRVYSLVYGQETSRTDEPSSPSITVTLRSDRASR